MPNHCENRITISHDDKSKLEAIVKQVKEKGEFFDLVRPIPAEIRDLLNPDDIPHYPQKDEAGNLLKCEMGNNVAGEPVPPEEVARMMKEHGASGWYDWCCENWGTKWDIIDVLGDPPFWVDEKTIAFNFSSAWCPPTALYEYMATQGYRVHAAYMETGCQFFGEFIANECGITDNWYYTSDFDGEPGDEDNYLGFYAEKAGFDLPAVLL